MEIGRITHKHMIIISPTIIHYHLYFLEYHAILWFLTHFYNSFQSICISLLCLSWSWLLYLLSSCSKIEQNIKIFSSGSRFLLLDQRTRRPDDIINRHYRSSTLISRSMCHLIRLNFYTEAKIFPKYRGSCSASPASEADFSPIMNYSDMTNE